MFKKLCSQSSSPTCVTVPLWGGQRSALRHQRRDVDAQGPQRAPGPPTGCSERVWESPGWQRWLWLAAPLWMGRPSGGRAARASGAGSRRRTCRLWWTPASGRKSPSANTQGDKTVDNKNRDAFLLDLLHTIHVVGRRLGYLNCQHPLLFKLYITYAPTFCALLRLISASSQAVWKKTQVLFS